MTHLLAQGSHSLGTFNGIGPLGNIGFGADPGQQSANAFTDIFSKILGVLTIVAGIWFMIQLILGAFGWLAAGGDKQHLENAKKRITNAVIGLFLVVISYSLVGIVGAFLGIDILNLGFTIRNLVP